MNEDWKNKLMSAVNKVAGNFWTFVKFSALILLLWAFVFPASLKLIFSLALLIVGLPLIFEIFGKDNSIIRFWLQLTANGGKWLILIALFMTFRAFAGDIVYFPLADSMARIKDNPLTTVIGFVMLSLKWEICFLLVVGGVLFFWIFKSNKFAKSISCFALILLFVISTFILAVGKEATDKASNPISQEQMAKAIGEKGIAGGSLNRLWVLLWGENRQIQKANYTPPPIHREQLGFGDKSFTLNAGQMSKKFKIPGDATYMIHSHNYGNYTLYYEDGTVLEIKDSKNQEFPIKTEPAFTIAARNDNMAFTILVRPRKLI